MDPQYSRHGRTQVYHDIESDDVPERSILATSLSSYAGVDCVDGDSTVFLNRSAGPLRPRGTAFASCEPAVRHSSSELCKSSHSSRSYDSYNDSGFATMLSAQQCQPRYYSGPHVKCDSLEGLEMDKLRLNSLSEDIKPTIQLTEIQNESVRDSFDSGLGRHDSVSSHVDSGISNYSFLQREQDRQTSGESGYYTSHSSHRSSYRSSLGGSIPSIPEHHSVQTKEEIKQKSPLEIAPCKPEELFVQNDEGDT